MEVVLDKSCLQDRYKVVPWNGGFMREQPPNVSGFALGEEAQGKTAGVRKENSLQPGCLRVL